MLGQDFDHFSERKKEGGRDWGRTEESDVLYPYKSVFVSVCCAVTVGWHDLLR